MTDKDFAAFVQQSRMELEQKQAVFTKRIKGLNKWFYDLETCILTFEEEKFPFTPIGTYNAKYETWVWGWANRDFPVLAKTKSKMIQGLFPKTEFRVFLEEGTNATKDQADDLVALSMHQLESQGFFRIPSNDVELPSLFLAIDK